MYLLRLEIAALAKEIAAGLPWSGPKNGVAAIIAEYGHGRDLLGIVRRLIGPRHKNGRPILGVSDGPWNLHVFANKPGKNYPTITIGAYEEHCVHGVLDYTHIWDFLAAPVTSGPRGGSGWWSDVVIPWIVIECENQVITVLYRQDPHASWPDREKIARDIVSRLLVAADIELKRIIGSS